jgi:hypothetical protein
MGTGTSPSCEGNSNVWLARILLGMISVPELRETKVGVFWFVYEPGDLDRSVFLVDLNRSGAVY